MYEIKHLFNFLIVYRIVEKNLQFRLPIVS